MVRVQRTAGRDSMLLPHRVDPCIRPFLAAPGSETFGVEALGNLVIGSIASQIGKPIKHTRLSPLMRASGGQSAE